MKPTLVDYGAIAQWEEKRNSMLTIKNILGVTAALIFTVVAAFPAPPMVRYTWGSALDPHF